jgi:2-phosphosulfolactate phosphatase
MHISKPSLNTCVSPALLHLYDATNALVVIIDVLRATSTIATALHHGAKYVVPVDSVAACMEMGRRINAVTAGERDGKIAEGLEHGNSPFEYPRTFIQGKVLVLTTTNGTKLLHMALDKGAKQIVTGSFGNLGVLRTYLERQPQNVILACAAWKDKVNLEDLLFAGCLIHQIKDHFAISCDSSSIAETLYLEAQNDLFAFLKNKQATHFERLAGFGLEKDIQYCLTPDLAPVLPWYEEGRLIVHPL